MRHLIQFPCLGLLLFFRYNPRKPFLSQIGITAVRGCEIEGQVDKTGKLIPDEERFGLVPKKGRESVWVCDFE